MFQILKEMLEKTTISQENVRKYYKFCENVRKCCKFVRKCSKKLQFTVTPRQFPPQDAHDTVAVARARVVHEAQVSPPAGRDPPESSADAEGSSVHGGNTVDRADRQGWAVVGAAAEQGPRGPEFRRR